MPSIKLTGLVSIAIAIAACASPPSSTFEKGPAEKEEDPRTGMLGGSEGAGASTPDEFKECATKTAAAESKPVYLVFMFDKSESMAWDNSPKWSSAKAASRAFFESAESNGVHASLSFFPDQESYSCSAGAYTTPSVTMTSLPSTSFGSSLDDQSPMGGTPTHVALEGAIAYAERVAADEGKDGKVAIVLVTDVLPDSDCDGNSVSAVKELAASVAARLPTYVIGVGDQLASLKDIAIGGGTKAAFIVKTNEPSQIQQDFLKAVNAIKASALACDYEIPPPPTGEQFDRNLVNVIYKSDAKSDTLSYNPSCSGGSGWRYDDTNDPKRILLCDASCDAVKAKPGQMDVLFGCGTKGVK